VPRDRASARGFGKVFGDLVFAARGDEVRRAADGWARAGRRPKSAMVKSVSWPMAETTGKRDADNGRRAHALAVEGGQVFSSDPPPRARTRKRRRGRLDSARQKPPPRSPAGRLVSLDRDWDNNKERFRAGNGGGATMFREVANQRPPVGRGDNGGRLRRKSGQRPACAPAIEEPLQTSSGFL